MGPVSQRRWTRYARTVTSERSRVYLDSSALAKLVVAEAETTALTSWLAERPVITSELAVTEVPRAVHRRLGGNSAMRTPALRAAERLLESVSLVPIRREILSIAGALTPPRGVE